jgi:hypothetical protein
VLEIGREQRRAEMHRYSTVSTARTVVVACWGIRRAVIAVSWRSVHVCDADFGVPVEHESNFNADVGVPLLQSFTDR